MIAPKKGIATALAALVCSIWVADSEGAVAIGAMEEAAEEWAGPPVATIEVEIAAEEWEWERGAEEVAAEEAAAEEAAAEEAAAEEAAAEEAAAEEAAAEDSIAEDLTTEDEASAEEATEEVEAEVFVEEALVEEAPPTLKFCSPHWALKADTAVSASPLGQIEFKVEMTVEPLDSQIQEKSWRPFLHSASLETWATAAKRQA